MQKILTYHEVQDIRQKVKFGIFISCLIFHFLIHVEHDFPTFAMD